MKSLQVLRKTHADLASSYNTRPAQRDFLVSEANITSHASVLASDFVYLDNVQNPDGSFVFWGEYDRIGFGHL